MDRFCFLRLMSQKTAPDLHPFGADQELMIILLLCRQSSILCLLTNSAKQPLFLTDSPKVNTGHSL